MSAGIGFIGGVIRRRLLPLLLTVLAMTLAQSCLAAGLPQEKPYQRVLREYLATLRAEDFHLGLDQWGQEKRFGLEPDWIDTGEKAYPIWLLVAERVGVRSPMLRAADESFTLAAMEASDGVRMDPNYRDGANPIVALFWAQWDYPGNPWHGSRALLNRAFVLGAVDLIMMDDLIAKPEGRGSRRTDFIGGRLNWIAYTYLHTKAHLPKPVAAAYEEGMLELLAVMEELGPDGRTDNMNSKAVEAMVHLSKASERPDVHERAERYARRVAALDEESRVHPVGVIRDAGGVEVSYNGIALFYFAHARLTSTWPFLSETFTQMMRFKGLMTLPDPDGTWVGPDHFNSRVGADAPNDQWATVSRDVATAMLDPQSRYLLARPGRNPFLLPELETMQAAITRWVEVQNESKPFEPYAFPVWNKDRGGSWAPRYPWAVLHYQPGFYTAMKTLQEEHSPALLPPVLANPSFEALLPEKAVKPEDEDTFFFVRRPSYYMISYTGHLGWHQYLNWGGGGFSAFWTPEAGTLILGRSAGLEANEWDDWRIWPVHAVSGEVTPGDAFSTARLNRRTMKVVYDRDGENPRVSVSANLNESEPKLMRKSFKGRLRGRNEYERVMTTTPDEVRVSLRLESDGQTVIRELFEALPVYHAHAWFAAQRELSPTQIELETPSGWKEATTDYLGGVTRVRLSRFNGGAEITFDRPRRVRIAPQEWSSDAKRGLGAKVRNLQIDLLETDQGPFPTTRLDYTIRNSAAPKAAGQ